MGSMHTGLEEAKNGFARLAEFYSERAQGGVGLILTGGISPNFEGRLSPFALQLSSDSEAHKHKLVTDAVHTSGGKIAMQILHAGRYAYHPLAVAPSRIRSPISPFKPWAMPGWWVEKTIRNYVRCAKLAQSAGYDGVEIMGSEGYLLNEFVAAPTNKRRDSYGGSYENRIRLPLEIVERVRDAVGPRFILIYRLSLLDLVPGGSVWPEVIQLGQAIEKAGATLINTGIGWHEARVPTIATMVPRATFASLTAGLKKEVRIPVITSNRINTPELAESLLAAGAADLISMARPLLADPQFVQKAQAQQSHRINTCIACNQACLDHIFQQKIASCLVNPRACHETELKPRLTQLPQKIAIVGAGPAGLSCAVTAASLGHNVTLFEAANSIGGQFNLAKKIPGKVEFNETLRYFENELSAHRVNVRLGEKVNPSHLKGFDQVVIATGVRPRKPDIQGVDHPKVASYIEVLTGVKKIGGRVAILGAGGIGFDIAIYLATQNPEHNTTAAEFAKHWGIDLQGKSPGGLLPKGPESSPVRKIYLLQRSPGKLGERLGKTTGWIHRTELKNQKVEMLSGVFYEKIDDRGLWIKINGEQKLLEVDNVVLCTGQESLDELSGDLKAQGVLASVIGGASLASELDAKRAIDQGVRLAYQF